MFLSLKEVFQLWQVDTSLMVLIQNKRFRHCCNNERRCCNGSLLLKAAMNFNDTEVTNKGDLETPSELAAYYKLLLGANTGDMSHSSRKLPFSAPYETNIYLEGN